MQKILFATDLDGTLLNDDQKVDPVYARTLKAMCERGLLFTIATARSPATAARVLDKSNVCLSAPAVCLNGALLWDMTHRRPVKSFALPHDVMARAWHIMLKFDFSPRMYACSEQTDGLFTTYYRGDIALSDPVLGYLEALRQEHTQVKAIEKELPSSQIISCSYYERREFLQPLCDALQSIEGIKVNFYTCTYREDYYFLEFCSSESGKGVGARAAAQLCGAELLYVFGDNLNDLDMFAVADRSFAPQNAVPAIKERAHEIIKSNNEGGIILAIVQQFNSKR